MQRHPLAHTLPYRLFGSLMKCIGLYYDTSYNRQRHLLKSKLLLPPFYFFYFFFLFLNKNQYKKGACEGFIDFNLTNVNG